MTRYQIVRFYFDAPREIRETDLTLAEAQAHCSRPDTSCHSSGPGAWFDGYEEME